jgi:N-acetylmuramoyl-L-alanine amidase
MRNILILIIILPILIFAGCDKKTGRLDLLVGDDSLNGFFSVESNSVTIYSSPADKKAGRIECRIYDDEYDVFIKLFRVLDDQAIKEVYRLKAAARFKNEFVKNIRGINEKKFLPGADQEHPLAGLRIAIDPGHSAGSMNEAMRENKYMLLLTPDRRRLKFYESQLNLLTAMILKDLLDKDGATVMLTRDTNRQTYPVSFDRWMRRDFNRAVREKLQDNSIKTEEANRLLYKAGDRARLKFFNSEYELPYRAKLINAFHPHLTVLAHYDANEGEPAYESKYLRIKEIMGKQGLCSERMEEIREVVDSIGEIKKDFCTVFVPGCFLRGELDAMESRIEFLRLIISPDLDNSVRYSKYVIDNFRRLLKVPAADKSFPGSFNVGFCRNGIYARNFRLTRLVRGTLCLGEPLQQNNMAEALQLADISDGKVPERVKIVARAYHDAIRKYVKNHMTEGL